MAEKNAPLKSLGQHFLINKKLCEQIVNLLEPTAEDKIVEIGPGPGALSHFLLEAPHQRVVFLEKDWRFAMRLPKGASSNPILTDALTFDWRKLRQNWKIIGNLPYNAASPLIWNILSGCPGLKRAVFMVQQEVAQRICAKSGNKDYGALSVWCQCHARCSLALRVGPGNFRPPPKVNSAVVVFEPLVPEKRPPKPALLKKLLDLLFQQRRKQLGTIIKNADWQQGVAALEQLGIPASLRPENLEPGQILALSEFMGE